jgi:acetyl-CoA C-acetyltransferase
MLTILRRSTVKDLTQLVMHDMGPSTCSLLDLDMDKHQQGERRFTSGAIGLQQSPPVYLISACRTPLGSFQGSLSHLSATQLGSIAIKAALERASISPEHIDSVYFGNVCSAGLGQAPARQAAVRAGLPLSTDCTTVNKVCSSGIKAITLAVSAIALGADSMSVAGGMESMSNIPFLAPSVRKGKKLGHTELLDGMIHDALWDSFYDVHMGECGEMVAEKMGISREEQDDHAVKTVEKAQRAAAAGFTQWEIVPVEINSNDKKNVGETQQMYTTTDEAISKMQPDKLRKLKPAFSKGGGGTITAGNASPITDGAAAVVLVSQQGLDHLNYTNTNTNIKPLARIVSFADAAQDPRDFPTSPALAINKALQAAGLSVSDIDYWEINEAFSVVDIANQRLLGLDASRVNVFGGSVALGHPVGASGCRIMVTLSNVLRVRKGRFGCAAICNGGGGATAIIVENMMKDEDDDKRGSRL